MKLNYKKTLMIGLGFFSVSMVWMVYNAYIPLILKRYIESTAVIGAVMAIDNVFGVIFQPLFGALSDKVKTPVGRRMPFILIGLPLSAVALSIAPWTTALPALMATLIVFNFLMSTWRAPVVTLMPDITPRPLRSQANGIINFMGGVGTSVALVLGSVLLGLGKSRLGEQLGMVFPFTAVAVAMIIAGALLFIFVREPKVIVEETEEKKERVKLRDLLKSGAAGRNLLFLLLAIFFWFTGYNAVETFFTTYAVEVLGLSEQASSGILIFYSASFLIMAIPAGYIGAKIGRKKTIMIGLFVLIAMFLTAGFMRDTAVISGLLLIGGCGWACVNINSLPMVLEMGSNADTGRMTGYYYFFSFSASIVSPVLYGLLRDITKSYATLFAYGAVMSLAALLFVTLVKGGEAVAKP